VNSLAEKQTERLPTRSRAWDRVAEAWQRHDALLYALFSATCTVYVAAAFYGYMRLQTRGQWSAPLDDVFIHFDYGRSFARGHPFQWSEGNGYSSGNTSLTYPLVLGLGYWLGLRDLDLMAWAALVACLGILALLYVGRHLLDQHASGLGPWAKYLLPPAILSMGVLDWTLFSGMENAFHLALWALLMGAALWQTEATHPVQGRRRAWVVGILGAVLVATRPESGVCVLAAGTYCAWRSRVPSAGGARAWGWRGVLGVLCAVGLPGVALLLLVAVTNYALTGEASANGAIAKLFFANPYMSPADMLERYGSLMRYIVPRLLEHHFAEARLADGHPWGYLVPALALVPCLRRRTRPVAILLWAQVIGWMLLVCLNNQVRWHNERYAMPAVAWLLVLATMGLGVIGGAAGTAFAPKAIEAGDGVRPAAPRSLRGRLVWPWRGLRAAILIGIAAFYWHHQEPRMRDQIWFFGRASRNILDQHVAAGRFLKQLGPKRVLVGDAGALMYVSDRPGLDLIGLGGYHDLPLARATLHGLGAAIELIEHIPADDRPDVMAIYPSWWDDLPVYFGRYVASFPVTGNVICGGAEKVIYQADWSALDGGGRPRTLDATENVADELDVADLESEQAHRYRFAHARLGFVQYRVLDDPRQPSADLFDAGRLVPAGSTEQAQLMAPRAGGRLVVRVAPTRPTRLAVTVDGQPLGELELPAARTGWLEPSIALPPSTHGRFELGLTPLDGESVHYHVWVVARPERRE
jgi:hypothetical protein